MYQQHKVKHTSLEARFSALSSELSAVQVSGDFSQIARLAEDSQRLLKDLRNRIHSKGYTRAYQ